MVEPSVSRSDPETKSIHLCPDHELQLERQAVRKFDYTILPIMTIFYLLGFLVCSI